MRGERNKGNYCPISELMMGILDWLTTYLIITINHASKKSFFLFIVILVTENEVAKPHKINGEGGIRTRGRGYYPYDGLANRCLQPLGHLS